MAPLPQDVSETPMSFLGRIAACNRGERSRYRPFRIAGRQVGHVAPDIAERLAGFPDVFVVSADAVAVADALATPLARTRAVARVLADLYAQGLFAGWRDEAYPVAAAFADPPLMTMERAAVPLFGVRAYGIHINGIVRGKTDARMWIARRSLSKPTGPGQWDQVVAGGQPAGLSLADNLIKECAEEAAISAAIARRAVPVGAISYLGERPDGLRNDVLFVYDLELPAEFTPVNTDGEVEDFHLWDMERLIATVRDTDSFKFNCALVVIDFLIRHGLISPDHPDYVDILKGLHR